MVWGILITFLINLFLGLPLFICLLTAALVGFFFVDFGLASRMLPQRIFSGIDSFSLMAIPLFILAGNLMNSAELTPKLINLSKTLVGHWKGGLGYVNVIASIFFAGVNGSAVADTTALGSLLVPAMKKEGYAAGYAAALTAGSSLIGPIIPPSIFMIIYASLSNVSVGDLFLAGIFPGLVLGIAFLAINAVYAARHHLEKTQDKPSLKSFFSSLIKAVPALLAPIIIVASIVFGLVTPTESGALIVLYAMVIGTLLKTLTIKKTIQAIKDATLLTCAIFIIIATSSIISWLLGYAQVPAHFSTILSPFIEYPVILMLIFSAITFVIGMLMEEVSALMLLTPVFMPIALQAGIDPIHLGIVITMNITIALITPPMGACLYVASAISKIELDVMFKSIWPFISLAFLVLVLIILFPSITLFFPHLFKS
ncbi:MAG: TRAP transporter large permease [Ostreibacterium sp.]